jgi:hypothetical protein
LASYSTKLRKDIARAQKKLGQEEVGKLYNEAEKRYHESMEEDSHWVAASQLHY